MTGQAHKGCEGLTLVETVVACSILAFVFSGFMVGFIAANRLQWMSGEHYVAMVIARNRVEEAKTYVYGSLPTMAETAVRVDASGDPCPTGHYWRTTEVMTAEVNPNLTEIAVDVAYEKRPGVTSSVPVTMRTMIGQ